MRTIFFYLEWAFPDALRGENDTSNNWSIPSMFFTKYWNFSLNISTVCFKTAWKLAFPTAIKLSCSSTADLMVGRTNSSSILGKK